MAAVIGSGKKVEVIPLVWKTIGDEKLCTIMAGKLYRSRKKLIFIPVSPLR